MKLVFSGIMVAILGCAIGLAQQPATSPTNGAATQNSQTPAPTSQPAAQNPQGTQATPGQPGSEQAAGGKKIAPGSVIPVQLTKTIDAKKAKVGDKVEAKVTQDMKAQNGQVVVTKDTKVIGKVTEAQPRDKQQKESQLAIAFDQMVTKESKDISVPMSIQAIIGQSNNSNAAASGTPESSPSASAPSGSGNTGARSGMGGGAASPPPAPSPEQTPTNGQTQASSQPQITGNTQGVIGISGLQLSSAQSSTQGSMMTSDKNNVKLESGTMLLLRVNQ
jgi:hypothetical protein